MDRTARPRVYVFGAGCSCHEQGGYPLASQFTAELARYGQQISRIEACEKIRSAVEQTVALFAHSQSGANHATTVDQLSNLILRGECDGYLLKSEGYASGEAVGLRQQAVFKAKVAAAACFLEKEAVARECLIEKYRRFIERKVMDGTGVSAPCLDRLQKSNARVISFNYDRLFELAFFAGFADRFVRHYYAFSDAVLNSGLTLGGAGMPIQKDRFCFLKLHGSIGMRCSEGLIGQGVSSIGDVANWARQDVTDDLFFSEKDTSVQPLIVFPFEKDYIVSGRTNSLPFRDYVRRIWEHATYVLQEASEIWIIGYSFDPLDCAYLVERIRNASNCECIIIQNFPAECARIRALLEIDYGIKTPIKEYPVLF